MSDPVTAALEAFTKGAIQKMEESEARRDRDFSYKLKELEFYKSNYDKEIKSLFDDWFNFLQNALLSTNKYLSFEEQKKYKKAVAEASKPETVVKRTIKTMKYGGTETGKTLALVNQITIISEADDECPFFAKQYAVCMLLSTLKKEILGQEITPITMMQILTNDYIKCAELINEGRCYVEEKRAELFPDEQMI